MTEIRLRPWNAGDRPLLHRANTPEMTRHLGGPETDDEVDARHERYLRLTSSGAARVYVIEGDEGPLGSIGWWMSQWRDADAHETGWFVLPEHQGRGVAAAGLALALDDVRAHATAPILTAFPSVSNAASNRVCERAGFRLEAVEKLPYRGTVLTTNVWVLDLGARQPSP